MSRDPAARSLDPDPLFAGYIFRPGAGVLELPIRHVRRLDQRARREALRRHRPGRARGAEKLIKRYEEKVTLRWILCS
jgi:hypothetical protein